MADPIEALPERVNAIEHKLDALSVSVDARFDAVDARFEFAFDRLRGEMLAGFAAQTATFGRLERKVDLLIDRLIGRAPDA